MRIGITGAFGFLGSNIVSALLDERRELCCSGAEPEIVAFASRTRSNPLFDASRLRVESLDILDREDAGRKFAGLDALIHLAGRVDYRLSERRGVWDANVLGTKRVFDAALSAGVPRILFASSICALGRGDEGALATESSAPYGDPSWPISFASSAETLAAIDASERGDYGFIEGMRVAYLEAKLAGWELAKAYARDKGLSVVSIFPGTTVGAGDIHFGISKLVDNVWEGRLRLSFRGSTAFVGARDLAKGALLALAKGRSGEGYIIGGRDEDNLGYVQFQDMVAGLARREGWNARRNPPVLPERLLLGVASLAQSVMPNGSLTKPFVLSGRVRNSCSSAKARSQLGYEPSPGLESSILECRRFSEAARARGSSS
jgi:dihydroflavonol-4-reductase